MSKSGQATNRRRFGLALFLYWLIAMGGAGAIQRAGASGSSLEELWILLTMLGLVSLCMLTERGRWRAWKLIGFVCLAWFWHGLLAAIASFLIAPAFSAADRVHLIGRTGAFLGSLPFVIYAMLQSYIFVTPDPLASATTNLDRTNRREG